MFRRKSNKYVVPVDRDSPPAEDEGGCPPLPQTDSPTTPDDAEDEDSQVSVAPLERQPNFRHDIADAVFVAAPEDHLKTKRSTLGRKKKRSDCQGGSPPVLT